MTHAIAKRPAPLSPRLSDQERQQLASQAGSLPLGSHIKSVVFAEQVSKYRKTRKPPVAEQQLLAEILARLGESRSASNLKQIAKHLKQGNLVVNEELEADLKQAVAEVTWMHTTLMRALKGKS